MEGLDSTLERAVGLAFTYGELIGTLAAVCVGCVAWTLLLVSVHDVFCIVLPTLF